MVTHIGLDEAVVVIVALVPSEIPVLVAGLAESRLDEWRPQNVLVSVMGRAINQGVGHLSGLADLDACIKVFELLGIVLKVDAADVSHFLLWQGGVRQG